MGSDLLIHRARAYRQPRLDGAYHETALDLAGGGAGDGVVGAKKLQVAMLVAAAMAAAAYLLLPRTQPGFDQSEEGKRRLWTASLAAAAVGFGVVLLFFRG